ncbi:hypothetical protein ACFQMM_16230 [Saliphagus sp. GCM10025308]
MNLELPLEQHCGLQQVDGLVVVARVIRKQLAREGEDDETGEGAHEERVAALARAGGGPENGTNGATRG